MGRPHEFVHGSAGPGPGAPPLGLFAMHELIYFGMRVAFAYLTKSGSTFTDEERKEAPVMPGWFVPLSMAGVVLNMLAVPTLFLAPRYLSFAAMPWSRATLLFGGLAFSAAGLSLQLAAHATLMESWSSKVETKHAQQLVTHGVYARVRHPMYTGV